MGSDKAGHELVHREPVCKFTNFEVVVIERGSHIPRIANDMNDPGITRVETLMALEDTRQRAKHSIREIVDHGNEAVHVGKGDWWFTLMNEIAEQKASPRAA